MSVVRLYFIIRSFYLDPEDRYYSLGYTTNTVEINLAVLCASAPALWPLFRRWFPGIFHSLGLDRPYLYPDIEVGYATQKSRASHVMTTPAKSYKVKVSWKEHRKTPSWVDRGKSPSAASSIDNIPPQQPYAHERGFTRGSDEEGSGSGGSNTLPIQLNTGGGRPRGNTNTTIGGASDRGNNNNNGGSSSPRSWNAFYDEEDDDVDDNFSTQDDSETYHGVLRSTPTMEHHNHYRDTIGQAR